jgi:hypothetical protein
MRTTFSRGKGRGAACADGGGPPRLRTAAPADLAGLRAIEFSGEAMFRQVLDQYFDEIPDPATEQRLLPFRTVKRFIMLALMTRRARQWA